MVPEDNAFLSSLKLASSEKLFFLHLLLSLGLLQEITAKRKNEANEKEKTKLL